MWPFIPVWLIWSCLLHAALGSLHMRVTSVWMCVGKEDGKTCKRVAIRTTIRKDDCRSNAPVRGGSTRAQPDQAESLLEICNSEWICYPPHPHPQVTIYSCDGKCPSATIFNFNINSHARFCKCCRESGLQSRAVSLYCSRNSTMVEYSFQEPLDCSCQWN